MNTEPDAILIFPAESGFGWRKPGAAKLPANAVADARTTASVNAEHLAFMCHSSPSKIPPFSLKLS